MIVAVNGAELANTVQSSEYNRLLQLPRNRELEGDLLDRATNARNWYANHGKPFVAARRIDVQEVCTPVIRLSEGTEFNSIGLAQRLIAGDSKSLVILAASAGPEIAEKVSQCWSDGRPDEAFFLDRFAVAVTEQLIQWSSAYLCRQFEAQQETLLPHLSPGCGNWDLQDQHKLMALLSEGKTKIGPVQLLESGALHPQHSVLAALGVTRTKFAASPKDICRACDLDPCAFRRVPKS